MRDAECEKDPLGAVKAKELWSHWAASWGGSAWHFTPTDSCLSLGRSTEQRNGMRNASGLTSCSVQEQTSQSETGVEIKATSPHEDKFLSKALGHPSF